MTGEREAERVVGEYVVAEVVAIAAIELHAVGIAFEPVAGEHVVVALQDLDALRRLRVGRGRAEDVVGDEVEGGAAGELRPVAVVEKLVAQHFVVERRGCGRAAIAVVAGDEQAGAAAVGDDAVIVDDVAARTMNENADAEIADVEPGHVDAAGIDEREPWIGQRAHIGAELPRHRARTGLRPLVLDVAAAVENDELAGSLPRRAFDADRTLDGRQRRIGLDYIGRTADRLDLDAIASWRAVARFDCMA
jgi:hypothetical protein